MSKNIINAKRIATINNYNIQYNTVESLETTVNKNRRSKRVKTKKSVPAEKDTISEGFTQSVASIIKERANSIYLDKAYHKLDNASKNTISNGFNSILDLSDNNEGKNSQKSFFTEDQWKTLNDLWNKKKSWKPLPSGISFELKEIETLAKTNIKSAYVKSLEMQAKYAFSENEEYFKVYSSILSTIHHNKNILNLGVKNKMYTEEDYVVNVWSPILSAGESVSADSSESKKNNDHTKKGTIGDKVDLRVCTRSASGKIVDLLNFEFSNNMADNKIFTDHRKTLCEAKTVADKFYRSPLIKKRTKKNLRSYSVQIAQVEGQITSLRLMDNGLYVATKIGSLRLPTSGHELRYARVVLERLYDLKDSAAALAAIYSSMEHEEMARRKSLATHLNNQRSPYDDDLSDGESAHSEKGKDFVTIILHFYEKKEIIPIFIVVYSFAIHY
ncbi:uncharacterized protein BX663DRAFT_584304 [Cokeromyces recurvatus]|uniref:uncharacterized protein n=1 Tax=Cokeromyces recurvatus TaxID=90255 RepID=UPI00221F4375|nr:uncharacterized protein BX663DRAFT_584304 [Cokeromyces recurvatus]KAI7897712.1 hypothetical protein BX663DRAFT_584304 [Cokeromyces recurvatus]